MEKKEKEAQFRNMYDTQQMINELKEEEIKLVPVEDLISSIKEADYLFNHPDAVFVYEISRFIMNHYANRKNGIEQLQYFWKILAQLKSYELSTIEGKDEDYRKNQLLCLYLTKEATCPHGKSGRVSDQKSLTDILLGISQVYDSTVYLIDTFDSSVEQCGLGYLKCSQAYIEFLKSVAPVCSSEQMLYSLHRKQIFKYHQDYDDDGLSSQEIAQQIQKNGYKIAEYLRANPCATYESIVLAVFGRRFRDEVTEMQEPDEIVSQRVIGQYPIYFKNDNFRKFK
jgi:hypothetical protein